MQNPENGEKLWIRMTSIPMISRRGKVKSVFTLFTDITDQKKTEEENHENREFLQLVMNNIPQFIFWKDKRSVYQGCNMNFARAAGMDGPREISGKTDFDLPWTREEAEAFRSDDKSVMERGVPMYHIIEPQLQADGRQRWVDTNKVPLKDERGDIIGLLGTYEDITERLNLQEELERVKNYLSNIINSMPSEIIGVDRDGIITLWNRQAKIGNSLPEEEAVGLSLRECYRDFPELIRMLDQVLATGEMIHKERVPRQRGEDRVFEDITLFPLKERDDLTAGAVIRIDDVSQNVKMQEQLLQSQKMDALGQLSGGMAHDFNNILGGIFNASELLSRERGLSEPGRKFLSLIRDSSLRARDVIQKLLTFSRAETEEFFPVDIQEILEDTVAILNTTLDKRILVQTDYNAGESHVLGNGSQLQTVFLNLAINAGHAMPEGGELAISTSRIFLNDTYCRASSFDLEKGEYVLVKVADTGTGIPADVLPRIFEPFFTTKEQGKGTGLGLSAAYGLIKQLKGAISVYSEPGEGTQFCLYLPLLDDKGVRKTSDTGELIRGSGTILLVEDDANILTLTEVLLTDLGYRVLKAVDGLAALQLFQKESDEIGLVISDMIMPRMNGADLFYGLRALQPDIPVIISSGFSHEGELEELQEYGLNGYIRKPYSGAALSQLIDRVMKEKNLPGKD